MKSTLSPEVLQHYDVLRFRLPDAQRSQFIEAGEPAGLLLVLTYAVVIGLPNG